MIQVISSSFKSHFEEDDAQNYLVFQPMKKYFKRINNTDYVLEWKLKGLSDKSIKPPSAPKSFLDSSYDYYGCKTRVKFSGSCLKQDNITYDHGKVVNIYIV